MYESVVALALLMTPCDMNVDYDEFDSPVMRLAFFELSKKFEVIDEREWANFYLPYWNPFVNKQQHFSSGVYRAQESYQELIGTPSIKECDRFHHFEEVERFLKINRGYAAELYNFKEIVSGWKRDSIEIVISENDQLCRILDKLYIAQDKRNTVYQRRIALAEFRSLIGDRAYCGGIFIPPVPYWRFPYAK